MLLTNQYQACPEHTKPFRSHTGQCDVVLQTNELEVMAHSSNFGITDVASIDESHPDA